MAACTTVCALVVLGACGGGGGGDGNAVQNPPDDAGPVRDSDVDTVPDTADNCPLTSNPAQRDEDGDGEGDACDPTPSGIDSDGDGVPDGPDNCPLIGNANQRDADGDGAGDDCDDTPNGPDRDGDGRPDSADNCPSTPNADQADADGDGTGDVCEMLDPDQDGDGALNDDDNCPVLANADQSDADGDGIGDVCDPTPFPDRDGDGVTDGVDNCPADANGEQRDEDGDGAGDACDDTPRGTDPDGDGVRDPGDNCPDVANPDQTDRDGDGMGAACDPDEVVADPSVLEFLEDDGRFDVFLDTARRFGLDAVLDGRDRPLTVFAPPDSAFDALDPAVRSALFADPGEFEAVVERHIVEDRAIDTDRLAELARTGEEPFGLNGEPIRIESSTRVNGHDLIGTSRVGRSIVHVVDGVFTTLVPSPPAPVASVIDDTNFRRLAERVLELSTRRLGDRYHTMVARFDGAAEFPGQPLTEGVVLTTVVTPQFGGSRAVYDCAAGGTVTRGRSGSRDDNAEYRAGKVFDACGASGGLVLSGSHYETGVPRSAGGIFVRDEFDITSSSGGASEFLGGVVEASPAPRFGRTVDYDALRYDLNDVGEGHVYVFTDVGGRYTDAGVRFGATLQADGTGGLRVALDLVNDGGGELAGTVRIEAPDGSSMVANGPLSAATVELTDAGGFTRVVETGFSR